MGSSSTIPYATALAFDNNRPKSEYELTVRQEPKQAQMCAGVGDIALINDLPADRHPIDPPPIVQLQVVDLARGANNSGQHRSNSLASPSTTFNTALIQLLIVICMIFLLMIRLKPVPTLLLNHIHNADPSSCVHH
ncbi:hypothetical protein BDP27DRAFT_1287769 [Rhodocollybia butyracea]|uniref:Velvet domain-containing protein n=1 Tax=Rhodocollybia butyracea TaxID=206335 RepID=A0A9P5Q2M4_9AGAR|nr:hypothetical protein BDP27DRAFT_1287769 [Rhodocollybia butyracea]